MGPRVAIRAAGPRPPRSDPGAQPEPQPATTSPLPPLWVLRMLSGHEVTHPHRAPIERAAPVKRHPRYAHPPAFLRGRVRGRDVVTEGGGRVDVHTALHGALDQPQQRQDHRVQLATPCMDVAQVAQQKARREGIAARWAHARVCRRGVAGVVREQLPQVGGHAPEGGACRRAEHDVEGRAHCSVDHLRRGATGSCQVSEERPHPPQARGVRLLRGLPPQSVAPHVLPSLHTEVRDPQTQPHRHQPPSVRSLPAPSSTASSHCASRP
eukprot:6636047-Pyramimonas_sp.AAC.1